MDLINKIRSTVSEVLPGNPLSSDYDISEHCIATAGPGLAWKVYNASKKTTKEVHVFGNHCTVTKFPSCLANCYRYAIFLIKK